MGKGSPRTCENVLRTGSGDGSFGANAHRKTWKKLSPPPAKLLILRFLPDHWRMLGGAARNIASDRAEILGVHPAWNPPLKPE
jgi:hypothetical protein